MSKLSLNRVVKPLLRSLDCPRSLTIWLLVSNNEHSQLLDVSVDPLHYNSSDDFFRAYQATKLLSKYPKLCTGVNTRSQAIKAFRYGEEMCKTTNDTYDSGLSAYKAGKPAALWIIHEARKIIARILGPDPLSSKVRKETFESSLLWGPGSTSAVKGPDVSLAFKLEGNLELTASLNTLLPSASLNAISQVWHDSHLDYCLPEPGCHESDGTVKKTIVFGNKVTFVPKNAKTDRSIAIEPHLNALVQKGVGGLIRMLLKRHGFDLNSDLRNRRLAQLGSADGSYATLDLKAASDTISISVVKDLLPNNWFILLDASRSHSYIDPETGLWRKYEKFSSMGNGFTFELESLIFLALAQAASDYHGIDCHDVAIFGDDIICRTVVSTELVEALNACGFIINSEKSFTSGPFRESCGGDFFLGVAVPSFQMKKPLTARELVVLHNKATEASLLPYGRDSRYKDFIINIRRNPMIKGIYSLGPFGHGGCLWSDFDEAMPVLSKRKLKTLHTSYYRVRCETFVVKHVCATTSLDVTANLRMMDKKYEFDEAPSLVEDPFLAITRGPRLFTEVISTSATAGRPLRGVGKWIFKEISVSEFQLLGRFI